MVTTGSQPRPVEGLTLAELAATRDDVERRISTLLEVLAEFHGHEPPPLLVDAGTEEAALTVDEQLRERGFGDQLLFSGSAETLVALRAHSPRARLMLAWDQPCLPSDDVIRTLRPDFLGTHYTLLARELVEEMHRCGHLVTAWTVNEFSDMARVIGMGVDALATERIEDLVPLTKGRQRKVPAAESA